jgi:hypothetical protein
MSSATPVATGRRPARSMFPRASARRSASVGRGRNHRVQPRQGHRHHRLSRPAQAATPAPRLFAAGAARHRRGGAGHRPLHRRGRLRRPAETALLARDCPRSRSLPPVGLSRGGHRDWRAAASRRPSMSAADQQFRGGDGVGPAGAVRLGQQPRLHGRLPDHAPLHFLLGDRRRTGRHAARRLVHHAPRCRRLDDPVSVGASPPNARGAPRRSQAVKTRVSGAVRGAAGHRPDRQPRACGQRRRAVPQVLLPARQPGQADLAEPSSTSSNGRTSSAAWARFLRQTTASPRATATWSGMASCRAISSAPTRPASWACRPPAMPAAATT